MEDIKMKIKRINIKKILLSTLIIGVFSATMTNKSQSDNRKCNLVKQYLELKLKQQIKQIEQTMPEITRQIQKNNNPKRIKDLQFARKKLLQIKHLNQKILFRYKKIDPNNKNTTLYYPFVLNIIKKNRANIEFIYPDILLNKSVKP